MPTDPEELEELKHLEDSLVHDEDEEPKPEGLGVYATPKFLSRAVLVAYGVMILLLGVSYLAFRGPLIPVLLTVALPFALVALYLNFVSPAEPDIAQKRTTQGRVITTIIVFIVMQAISVFLWWATAKAFTLS
jgi:hypothetical protein